MGAHVMEAESALKEIKVALKSAVEERDRVLKAHEDQRLHHELRVSELA